MPTQSSTLSPSDSPANRLNLLCFLSKKFHLSYRSLLLIPLSLQPPFCFFPLSPPPPCSPLRLPHMVVSAPPFHQVADASLPDSSDRT